MILWTIQSKAAYKTLLDDGYLLSNSDVLNHKDLPLLQYGYNWMSNKLRKAVGTATGSVLLYPMYPLWAWYKIDGKSKKPDLRCSGYDERGKELVLLKIDIPDEEVLLSDFVLFSYVLNFMYAGKTLAEDNKFEHLKKVILQLTDEDIRNFTITNTDLNFVRRKIIDSWDNIFDITSEDYGYFYSKDRTIQAVFWEIRLNQVIEAIPFIAK